MHPLEGKINTTAKTDTTPPETVAQLRAVLAPLVGMGDGYHKQLEVMKPHLTLSAQQQADYDGVLAALRSLAHYTGRLMT